MFKKQYDTWLEIANKTTKNSNLYGCNLILNQLYPNKQDRWQLIKEEYKKDIKHSLPYPLEGLFLKAFREYLVLKLIQKYEIH